MSRRLILANYGSGGDIEIDTNIIYYTSSNGNVVTPSDPNVFGANIISNTYIDGQGIISFDGPVTTIGSSAFYHRSNLTSIVMPNSVTEIGESVFYYCRNLTSVTIPDSVTTIGEGAFFYCTSLESVTIPESVTSIGDQVFYYCQSLTSVYCKATTPPVLGRDGFYKNSSDRKIYVPTDSVNTYKNATNWSTYASAIVGYNF